MLTRAVVFMLMWFPILVNAETGAVNSVSEMLKSRIRMVQHMALNPTIVKAARRYDIDVSMSDSILPDETDADAETAEDSLKINQLPDHELVMQRFIERNRTFTEIRLADTEGVELTSYSETKGTLDPDILDSALSEGVNRVFVGPLTMDEKTRTISTVVSAPVMDRDQSIGVLVVGVRLDGSSSRAIN